MVEVLGGAKVDVGDLLNHTSPGGLGSLGDVYVVSVVNNHLTVSREMGGKPVLDDEGNPKLYKAYHFKKLKSASESAAA